jgi:hypothetical protein
VGVLEAFFSRAVSGLRNSVSRKRRPPQVENRSKMGLFTHLYVNEQCYDRAIVREAVERAGADNRDRCSSPGAVPALRRAKRNQTSKEVR